jgi:multidrug efflux system membrane fusion protein
VRGAAAACVVLLLAGAGVAKPGQPVGSNPLPEASRTSQLAHTFGGEKAVTRPSRDSTLSFPFPVEIAEVLHRGGARVAKGDLLIRGRDEEYRYQRDLQKLVAESELDIQRAEAALEQAKVEFDAQTELRDKKQGGNKLQYDTARTAWIMRGVEVDIAKRDHAQQIAQLAARQAQLDRLSLLAPFDGRVDFVHVDVGEVKRETEPVVRIVATDKLWIDVNTPTHETLTLGLKPGDRAWVLLDVPGEPQVHIARVIEVAPDANFEANLRRVRVELENPRDWPSGLTSWVRFTPPTGEWAARIVEAQARRAAAGEASHLVQGGGGQ